MSVLHAVMHADTSDGELHAEMRSGVDGVQAATTTYTDADHMVWDSSSSFEELDRIVVQTKSRPPATLEEDQVKHLCWSGNTGVALPVTLQPAGRKAAVGGALFSRFEASGAGSDSTIGDGSAVNTAGTLAGYVEDAQSWRRKQQVAPRFAVLAEALKKPGPSGDAAASGAEADIEIDGLDSESGLSANDGSFQSAGPETGQGETLGARMDSPVKQECIHLLAKRKKRNQILMAAGMKKPPTAGGTQDTLAKIKRKWRRHLARICEVEVIS
eukprot:TRINITY_DN7839_c0_g1_i2.p1 TRINITY_DN7839_c0_g1~~TRINITY_DN7839_c0_g1_i2.p1  ORF type:complete len:271 (-),score=58.53 TRINITY_DN7839_c0_g1_i2:62-874(-)